MGSMNGKTMKKKIAETLKWAIGTIICFAVAAGILYAVYYMAFVRLPRGEIQTSCISPTGAYTVNLYLCNGGATVDYSIRGEVVFNNGSIFKKKRDIYWQYHETEADCVWVTEHAAAINGRVLDVRYDSYDWRHPK